MPARMNGFCLGITEIKVDVFQINERLGVVEVRRTELGTEMTNLETWSSAMESAPSPSVMPVLVEARLAQATDFAPGFSKTHGFCEWHQVKTHGVLPDEAQLVCSCAKHIRPEDLAPRLPDSALIAPDGEDRAMAIQAFPPATDIGVITDISNPALKPSNYKLTFSWGPIFTFRATFLSFPTQ